MLLPCPSTRPECLCRVPERDTPETLIPNPTSGPGTLNPTSYSGALWPYTYLDPKVIRQNNGPQPLEIAQKNSSLHTFGFSPKLPKRPLRRCWLLGVVLARSFRAQPAGEEHPRAIVPLK